MAANERLLQLKALGQPRPDWVVVGAGFDWAVRGDASLQSAASSRIEGVGSSGPIRFGETFSLQREVVDRLMKVPDALTMAGMHLFNDLVGFRVGPSSGLNLIGALRLACEWQSAGIAMRTPPTPRPGWTPRGCSGRPSLSHWPGAGDQGDGQRSCG